jgi:cyanophycinase
MRYEKPRGILIPIGGHEQKKGSKSILSRVIDETRKKNPIIEIVTVATNLPEETSEDYFLAFEALGLTDTGEIHIKNRSEIADFTRRIETCDAVLFSGGNQLKLTALLGGTDFISVLKDRYYNDDNFVIAGTSAGATAMSNTMILKGSSEDALIKGELQLTNGLDFIDNLFIDTHLTQRGRIGRLIQTVTGNPGVLGLGLGEDTGAVIYNGNELEVIGSGLVVIADGLNIKYSNLTDIEDGEAITVEGITLHVLGKGKIFSLEERRLLKSEDE